MPSEKILNKKRQAVQDLAAKLKEAKSIILVDYRGLTVAQDTDLRSRMRKAGVTYKVVKNSTVSLALKECNYEVPEEALKGPIAIAYSEDLIAPAKTVCEFAKENNKFEIKTGLIEGNAVSVDEVKSLASLPPKEVLIAKVLGGFNAPISGFVNVLNANITGLVRVLGAIAEKKED